MNETQRRAYLGAMGLEVWVSRPAAPAEDRLVLGPGAGRLLFVAAAPDDTTDRLAGDIARVLGEEPVWAWPDPEGRAESPTLSAAIEEGGFERVFVFGEGLARRPGFPDADDAGGSVLIVRTQSLDTLAASADAKRKLWSRLANCLKHDGAERLS